MANGSDVRRYDFDRERGIFTPRDRRFLAGELDDELTPNEKRQKRFRLRRRVFHAIQDLAYLGVMDTDDLFRVADDIEESITPQVDPTEEQIDPERFRRIERITTAAEETLALFYHIHVSNFFGELIKRQMAIQATLDYYDETGRYGVFEPILDVELKEDMSIQELREMPLEELNQLGEYYGWREVLSSHGGPQPSWKHEPEPENPELVATVTDVIEDLAETETGATRDAVAREVAERAEISQREATEGIQDALLSGRCYETEDGEVKAV